MGERGRHKRLCRRRKKKKKRRANIYTAEKEKQLTFVVIFLTNLNKAQKVLGCCFVKFVNMIQYSRFMALFGK